METLPIEMVEKIVQQLTLQDLARCSAVCREWREIFNQDCMWKPHCDSELEEPLRTIPCVATPAFVAPEAENSTLSPVSRWKLAFMREKHLWEKWRSKEIKDKNENVIRFGNENIVDAEFLSDTLVVVWYYDHIEIVDVSVVPTALVTKTDTSAISVIGGYYRNRVIGSTMLLGERITSIHVFNVDVSNSTITLKHAIPLTRNMLSVSTVAKEQFFLCLVNERSKLTIVDLNIGKFLKEEPCPGKVTQNEKIRFEEIKSSPTGDFVACLVFIQDNSNGRYKYYIYSLKQLAFLPGPVAEYEDHHYYFALLGDWLATTDYKILKVYNLQTRDVLLSYESSIRTRHFPSLRQLEACNGCFVFKELSDNDRLKLYFPSYRTLTTLCKISNSSEFRIINNKFISIFNGPSQVIESVWKTSGQTVERCGVSVMYDCKINRSFTKVLNRGYLNGRWTFDINYVW